MSPVAHLNEAYLTGDAIPLIPIVVLFIVWIILECLYSFEYH